MKAIGVIPARWASTRFEGKPLAEIIGKPLIQHVWERARKARLLDDLIVACDDERVLKAVKKFGGKACFTSPKQPSGTDRIAEVVNAIDVDIVVNIQGDEPLIEGLMIDNLVSAFSSGEKVDMATIVKKIDDVEQLADPNTVKVVLDRKGYALYFSRSAIPYVRDAATEMNMLDPKTWFSRPGLNQANLNVGFFKHIGIYAYTKDFLFTYTNLPFSKLENAEKLEQLRALEAGFRVKTVETGVETIGVDTPEDLEKVKKHLT